MRGSVHPAAELSAGGLFGVCDRRVAPGLADHVHRGAVAAVPICDELGDDADRDLDRRAPAERQTDRCAHAREIRQRTTELALAMQDATQHRMHLATAADHAEIAMRSTQQPCERLLV